MSSQLTTPRSLPRQWQQHLKKLVSTVRTRNLLHVLDSFPSSTTLEFEEEILDAHKAIRVFIGHREQADGDLLKTWAYVLSDGNEIGPAVLFRDEVPTSDGEGQLYLRAASSLLRRATRLHPPFCFLQFDSEDKVTNVRGMLCALVVYYFLSAGIHDCALHWKDFEVSLFQALEYVGSRVTYQQWRQEEAHQSAMNVDYHTEPIEDALQTGAEQAEERTSEDRDASHEKNGGTVRSMGSSVKAKAGSTLAELIKAMGHRVQDLEGISIDANHHLTPEPFYILFPFPRTHWNLPPVRCSSVYSGRRIRVLDAQQQERGSGFWPRRRR